MQRWKPILFNIAFSLNCLLLFLVLFEQYLQVPVWLQVVGRMHPLILHFPIVLLVLAVFWELLPRRQKGEAKDTTNIGDALLLSAALSTVFTSLIGLFLSREEGYEPAVLQWHKWGGVFISLLSLIWYSFRRQVRQVRGLMVTTAMVGLTGIVITGHQGANITHGEDFLLAPLHSTEEAPVVLLEDAVVYTDMVKPILEAKCTGCHNPQKAKGELVMETEASILKGGKSGVLWDTTANDFGLLMQRVHLPLDNKKHMPPKGKPQLTEEEIIIIQSWIKNGAEFRKKLADLPPTDTLHALAAAHFSSIETDIYTFAPADENEIKKRNTSYRVIAPLATGSPALGATFYSAQNFSTAALKELESLKEQVVSLNLGGMPLQDEDLAIIAQFKNLRKLNVSFTNITGSTLSQLKGLTELRQLSLSGTNVKWHQVQTLVALPRLTRIYLWNTGVQPAEIAKASSQYKTIRFESGYSGDTVVLKLNPPIVANEEQIVQEPVPLKLKHFVRDVSLRYTVDGTEPDSLSSPVYNENLVIDKNLVLKAKAFKKGWISSDVVERRFYKRGRKPDTVIVAKAPDPAYRGDGGKTLVDNQKGDQNFRSGLWLGYKDSPLTALFQFKQPLSLSSVTVSSLVDIGSYIMPPAEVEVWGGPDALHLRLLKRMLPAQPKEQRSSSLEDYPVTFTPVSVSVIKIIVKPVAKLPSWHQGRGEKAWIFLDEVFFQ
ncbi:chitobiase/beta-hexosaminidase C-terminal domain-containing protein [Flavisolibacter sp. BT320]|nr:chitobiase/beta-hexosaminidase C-terminal domain-containing protein [Flavisolibacter longurius]